MKMLFVECDAEELRANRRIMDSVVDIFSDLADSFMMFPNNTDEAIETEEKTQDVTVE